MTTTTSQDRPRLVRVWMRRTGIHSEGPLSGRLTFKGRLGEVELTLTDEACQRVLAAMADGAAIAVAEIADALRGEFKP